MSPNSSRWGAAATCVASIALTVLALSGGGLVDEPPTQLLGGTITCCSK